MYINEVLRRVKNYCPSEYSDAEMYSWCDEVSSMLAIEDRNVFVKVTISPDSDGNVYLPEGVAFENVIRAEKNGRELSKEDERSNRAFTADNSPVTVTYLAPYTPIRIPSYRGRVVVDNENSRLIINASGFIAGDSILVNINGVDAKLHIIDAEYEEDEVLLYVDRGSLDGLADDEDGKISRIVTEKTVCDSPYDGMYVDYLIAKICMYQRDFSTYNQFMTSFNSRLDAYKRWITNQLPQSGGKLKNWW